MKVTFYIVRHTQTVGNVEKRLTGREDYNVTINGEKYIELLTKRLVSIDFDKVYASTSGRAIKTVKPLAIANGLDVIEDENLCEMYFGIYDGWKWEDVNKVNPNIDKLHKETNEIIGIENQETTEQVRDRMTKAITKIAEKNLGSTILVGSHGVAIEAFLRGITGIPFLEQIEEYSQKNTCVNIVEYDSETKKFELKLLNDISHLTSEKYE